MLRPAHSRVCHLAIDGDLGDLRSDGLLIESHASRSGPTSLILRNSAWAGKKISNQVSSVLSFQHRYE